MIDRHVGSCANASHDADDEPEKLGDVPRSDLSAGAEIRESHQPYGASRPQISVYSFKVPVSFCLKAPEPASHGEGGFACFLPTDVLDFATSDGLR